MAAGAGAGEGGIGACEGAAPGTGRAAAALALPEPRAPSKTVLRVQCPTMMLRLFMSGTSPATAAARTTTGRRVATAGRPERRAAFWRRERAMVTVGAGGRGVGRSARAQDVQSGGDRRVGVNRERPIRARCERKAGRRRALALWPAAGTGPARVCAGARDHRGTCAGSSERSMARPARATAAHAVPHPFGPALCAAARSRAAAPPAGCTAARTTGARGADGRESGPRVDAGTAQASAIGGLHMRETRPQRGRVQEPTAGGNELGKAGRARASCRARPRPRS
jgi:hypothetical protein